MIAGCKPAAFFPLAWTMLINLAGIKVGGGWVGPWGWGRVGLVGAGWGLQI